MENQANTLRAEFESRLNESHFVSASLQQIVRDLEMRLMHQEEGGIED
jgi:hypothetical protein